MRLLVTIDADDLDRAVAFCTTALDSAHREVAA
jgi:hypothetical protein